MLQPKIPEEEDTCDSVVPVVDVQRDMKVRHQRIGTALPPIISSMTFSSFFSFLEMENEKCRHTLSLHGSGGGHKPVRGLREAALQVVDPDFLIHLPIECRRRAVGVGPDQIRISQTQERKLARSH